ncbi:hypothetical protein KST17_00125 [Fusobacterium canifelinum]|uniref:hypothetical protein n=1 Tax=Fusobacterium canifelinum TaxID=285729 RepID=UPI0030CDD4CA
MKKIIFLLTIAISLIGCDAIYPVANYNLKDYNKNSDGTYTRKIDENGRPVKNTKNY